MGRANVLPVYSQNVPRIYAGSRLWSYGLRSERRIICMMAECIARKLTFSGKMLLNLAVIFAIAAPLVFGVMAVHPVRAQAAPAAAPDLAATWQGTLHAGQDLRTVLKVTKAA